MEIPKRIRTFTLGPFLLSFGNLDWKVWWITPNPWQNMVNRCEFFRNPMEISKVKEVWDAKLTTLKTNMTKLENPKCSIGDYICIHGGFSRNRHVSFFWGGWGMGVPPTRNPNKGCEIPSSPSVEARPQVKKNMPQKSTHCGMITISSFGQKLKVQLNFFQSST